MIFCKGFHAINTSSFCWNLCLFFRQPLENPQIDFILYIHPWSCSCLPHIEIRPHHGIPSPSSTDNWAQTNTKHCVSSASQTSKWSPTVGARCLSWQHHVAKVIFHSYKLIVLNYHLNRCKWCREEINKTVAIYQTSFQLIKVAQHFYPR